MFAIGRGKRCRDRSDRHVGACELKPADDFILSILGIGDTPFDFIVKLICRFLLLNHSRSGHVDWQIFDFFDLEFGEQFFLKSLGGLCSFGTGLIGVMNGVFFLKANLSIGRKRRCKVSHIASNAWHDKSQDAPQRDQHGETS